MSIKFLFELSWLTCHGSIFHWLFLCFLQIEGHFGGIRVISEGWKNQILIGTTKNCILCGSCEKGFQPIILGHTDELWGLASHPCLPHFVTAGHDRVLQLWDSMSHSILWSKDIGVSTKLSLFHNGRYWRINQDFCITFEKWPITFYCISEVQFENFLVNTSLYQFEEWNIGKCNFGRIPPA